MIEFILFFFTPLIGTLLFITFMIFLERLKQNKSTYTQKVIGAVLMFLFIVAVMFSLGIVQGS